MKLRRRPKTFSGAEIFLPLLFFSGAAVFYASAAALTSAGLMLVMLELLRRQNPHALGAFYLFGMAVFAATAWLLWGLPPYWILCAHLLVPEAARAPSAVERSRPFGFGFKKYKARRTREFAGAFLTALIFSFFINTIQSVARGFSVWLLAVPGWILAEILMQRLRKEKQ